MLENFKKSGYIGKNRNWIRYFPFTKFGHIGMNVTTKFHWDGFNGDKDINSFLGNYRKKLEIPAKTGTRSGKKRVQNFRHIGRNVHTKFHRDGFSGNKDIIGYMGNYGKNRKFRLKPEPDPEIWGCKISGTLAGMFIPSFIRMVSEVTKI